MAYYILLSSTSCFVYMCDMDYSSYRIGIVLAMSTKRSEMVFPAYPF